MSLKAIVEILGDLDHSTVISANTKIKGFLKIHDGLATEAVNVIEESLKYV